jgi:hypothetical protein
VSTTPDPSAITYYAHRRVRADGLVSYFHASPSRWWVELHGSTEPVVTIRLRERTAADAPSSYFAWLRFDRPERYAMVWPSEGQLEMCFPGGSQAEADRGLGRKVNLIVEEVTT